MSTSTPRSIRNFIYLDVDKLYSMYSQVFEQVADRIVEETFEHLISGDTQRSRLSQAESSSESGEFHRHTETGVLHDHMYNRLEFALADTFFKAEDIDLNNLYDTYMHNPLVKIAGPAEIEDYEYARVFMENFNSLGQAIAYSSMSSAKAKEEIDRLEAQLQVATNTKQRNDIQAKIKNLKDVRYWAEELGLYRDPQMIKNLQLIISSFKPNGYSIIVSPVEKYGIRYRGVLDKTWLRIDPLILRSLYGVESAAKWTMVGTVTKIPRPIITLAQGDLAVPDEILSEISNVISADNLDVSMLDALTNFVRSFRALERAFLESKQTIEIIVSPLAIYSEFSAKVNVSSKSGNKRSA